MRIVKLIFFPLILLVSIVLASAAPLEAASVADTHKTEQTIRYANEVDYPPFTMYRNGAMEGFDVEMLRMLMTGSDYEVVYSGMDWQNIYAALQNKKVDCTGLAAITDARKQDVLFTKPVLKSSIAVYTLSDYGDFSIDDLKNVRVGVQAEDYAQSILQKYYAPKKVSRYPAIRASIDALLAGKIDAVFANQEAMNYYLAANALSSKITVKASDLHPVDFAFAVSKDHPQLVVFLNKRLREVKGTPIYESLFLKYFFRHSQNYAEKAVMKDLTIVIAIIIAIILLFLLNSWLLRRRIKAAQKKLVEQHDESMQRLKHQAHHDQLTGLPNRMHFDLSLIRAISGKRSRANDKAVAVMFIDLDRFKTINKTFGHSVGDEVLCMVAERFRKCLPEQAVMARSGGDEFLILVEGLQETRLAHDIAECLIASLVEPFNIEEGEFYTSASIGISVFPYDGLDALTLQRNADTAMYRAKEDGRNCFCFYNSHMHKDAEESFSLENDLRHAVERGEIAVHYQPQYDISSGRMTGVECLARWNRPGHGLVSPVDFIPVAEDTGLIVEIDRWIMETACMQVAGWIRHGCLLEKIAVNLSALTFRQPGLIDAIEAVLEKSGLPAEKLEIEITESLAMRDSEFTLTVLNRLKEMQIGIAIDDFGTKYSSLHYLRQFPINTLKIDKSFTFDIGADNNDEAIIRAIIGIGKALGLTVLAEGVETHEQLAFLREEGCHEMQGYLMARPMPAEDLIAACMAARQLVS